MFRPLLTCPTYHYIGDAVPAAAAHLGVSTATGAFHAHLDYYAANYDIVDLDTLLSGKWPRRPLLLTFDDSYRCLADTVAPILKQRGLRGVAFLNPDMIERPTLQFDHVLSLLAERVGTTRVLSEIGPAALQNGSVQAYLNGSAIGLKRFERADLQQRLLGAFGLNEAELYAELDLYLRPGDISRLTDAGLEIANHTASHMRCRALTRDDLAVEVRDAKHRLEALARRPVRAFSVPYGSRRDATPETVTALAESGHAAVFLVEGRLSPSVPSDLHIWDRIPVDGIGVEALSRHLTVRPHLRGIKDLARRWARPLSAKTMAQSATAPLPSLLA